MNVSGVIAALLLLPSAMTGAGISADGEYAVGNSGVRVHLAVRDSQVSTTSIENLITGEATPFRGVDFRIRTTDGRVVTNRDMLVSGVADLLLPGASGCSPGRKLVISTKAKSAELRIDLILEARGGETWVERYLELYGARPTLLEYISLAEWDIEDTAGSREAGPVVQTLGFPEGCGQPVFARDFYIGIAHPGAENFVGTGRITLGIPAYAGLDPEQPARTPRMIVGAGAKGENRRAFLRFLHGVRGTPQRMINLVNDWYWSDKSKPLPALKQLVSLKQRTGIPVDSFTLDDGWSSYTDISEGIWGALDGNRFPEGWDALRKTAAEASMSVSLWFGPIGGYGYRARRIPLGRSLGYEVTGDRFCLAGTLYGADVRETFARWARLGMDFIKVDGFWPDCRQQGHGHPIGPGAPIAEMDSLIDVFAAWRRARPELAIAYTSGSNPSPFWLLHCDYVWRAGADDEHAGQGAPCDRYATFIDTCLQGHRGTQMPASAFVTFDLITRRILPSDDDTLRRGFWWAAARSSLHHDWYLHPTDLTDGQWRALAEAARWAKGHEKEFRFSRMIGGDVRKGEAYGFACYDGRSGTLALRNPDGAARVITGTLREWLDLTPAEQNGEFRLQSVFGQTAQIAGLHAGADGLRFELPGFEVAVFEISGRTAPPPVHK